MDFSHVIPNLFCVEQAQNIWRGGQPTDAGQHYLRTQLGIHRIVKLNTESEGRDVMAERLGMTVYRFPIPWWQQTVCRPSQSLVVAAVAAIWPDTFIHCGSLKRTLSEDAEEDNRQGGQDRTSLIVGCYLLSAGLPKSDVYADMLAHGFHAVWLGGLQGRWNTQDPQWWMDWRKTRT